MMQRPALALVCLICTVGGCSPSDSGYAKKLLGTWEDRQTTRAGVFIELRTNLMAEGKYSALGTATIPGGEVIPVAVSGTWYVKDGHVHTTIRSTNIPRIIPVGFVHVEKIISLTDRECHVQGPDGVTSVSTRVR